MVKSTLYHTRFWRLSLLAVLGALALGLPANVLRANLSAYDISGPISVIDGDTFEVAGTKVRLHAIDAPESAQTCQTAQNANWACGGWVTRAVSDRYQGVMANCSTIELDRYGRTVARCSALGEDVGAWLVQEGMAFAYVEYGTDYVGIERKAASLDRGLHAVKMQTPAQYRKSKRRVPVQKVVGDCVIKGNISAKGEKIYHVVGQKYYMKTRIDLLQGERWFCSEAAAVAAGWRKSRI